MRKKLFAVIMSAMMMITFMPAMAFAGTIAPEPTAHDREFQVTNVNGATIYTDYDFDMNYDGAESEVSYVTTDTGKIAKTTTYTAVGEKLDGTTWTYAASTTAPKIKDAGKYYINVEVKYSEKKIYSHYEAREDFWAYRYTPYAEYYEAGEFVPESVAEDYPNKVKLVVDYEELVPAESITDYIVITILPRPVDVKAAQYVTLTKDYNGEGFTVDDSFFQISAVKGADGKDVANTGLVAGDKLILDAFKTPADVDKYVIDWTAVKTNKNYTGFNLAGLIKEVSIVQAGNDVTLSKTNKTFKIKGKKTTVKKSFNINPKANWGTVKVTKVGGSGYLYLNGNKVVLKKGAKKGTYTIKVKAYVTETKNWKGAELTKTIRVKVK